MYKDFKQPQKANRLQQDGSVIAYMKSKQEGMPPSSSFEFTFSFQYLEL